MTRARKGDKASWFWLLNRPWRSGRRFGAKFTRTGMSAGIPAAFSLV